MRGVLIFSLIVVLATIVSAQKRRPNFIVIMTDDQGFDDYGFRQPPLQTPTMDKIVKQGVQFTRFYTGVSCAPTRAQLMTGRNFMRTGSSSVGFGGDGLHLDEYLIGEAMQDAGYATGMMGKWNLGTADAEMPSRRGFDETWQVAGKNIRRKGRYDHFNPSFFSNGTFSGIEFGWQVEHVTNKAIDFIRRHKNEDFFLYLPYAQPHEPWLCPKALQNKYMKMGISPSYATFLGMMEQLDTQVGRVLQALKNHGIADDTIVFFFGDNGPTPKTRIMRQNRRGFYAHTGKRYFLNATEWETRNPTGLRGQKAESWENGYRNRLSVYCPGKYNAKKIRNMTVAVDVYPTLLDLAGANRKKDVPPLDGRSLKPFLDGGMPKNWPRRRRYLTAEPGNLQPYKAKDGWSYRFTKLYSWPMNKRTSCFVLGPWVIVNDGGKWGLFHVIRDPQQKRDLKSIRPDKFAELQRNYFEQLANIRKDPHAWSDPVQVIGLPDVDDPYIEMSYIYRWRGNNSVWWTNSFFKEVGASQELKVRVLKPATYNVMLHAWPVPAGTKIRLRAGTSRVTVKLRAGKVDHYLGQIAFKNGDQTMTMTVVECDDPGALSKMAAYNLRLTKVA